MYLRIIIASFALARAMHPDFLDAVEITSRGMRFRRLQETTNETSNATGNETNQTAGGTTNQTNETAMTNQTVQVANATSTFDYAAFASAYMLNNETDSSCSQQCCMCVANTTQMLLQNATGLLNASCSDSENRGTIAVCDFFQNQPNVSIGMMLGFGNIPEIANAYCVGNGNCTGPAVSEEDICPADNTMRLNASDSAVAQLILSGRGNIRGLGVSYVSCLLNTGFSIMDRRTAIDNAFCENLMSQESTSSNQTDQSSGAAATGNETNQTSSSSSSSAVCTYDNRVCEYAKLNPDVAWGYRYSRVQPLKFARGFCAGLLVDY